MSSAKEYIRSLHTVHLNSLTAESPTVDVPPNTIKIPMHAHQKAVLAQMEAFEQGFPRGKLIEKERVYSNYGILGDSVGVGKSLMILGHIARLSQVPEVRSYSTCPPSQTSTMFSVKTHVYSDLSEVGCLIIVPHTLFRQWSTYIQKQTTLANFCVSKASQVESDSFEKWVKEAQVVLISNTLVKQFIPRSNLLGFRWKRLFIDEADTIHLTGGYMPRARFTWFVTASWSNMLYLNSNTYLDKNYIVQTVFSDTTEYPHLKEHFKSRMNTNAYYYIEQFRVRSYSVFRDIINSSHPLRSHLVIRCSDEYIQTSISLPPLLRSIIQCKAPIGHQIIRDAITPDIQQKLNAGDVAGALEGLGVKGTDTRTLIDAVTGNLHKELVRLKKVYDFKESLEYSSAAAKTVALASLQEKIDKTVVSINAIQERIESAQADICPICYDEPTNSIVTPCCARFFCGGCLLASMAVNPHCPLCRAAITPSSCTKIVSTADMNTIVAGAPSPELEKKQDALMRILEENPQGRFLVFSRYDNPFESLEATMDTMGIKVKQLKGNKDAIASTLRSFESGGLRCLLLNSQFAGSGLNITAATHVILLHAMSREEEKQILGRAYRIGRKGPLNYIKLLHKGEDSYVDVDADASMQ